MTRYLSEIDVRAIRRELAAATGERFDMLNHDGLLSALAAPRQTMFGEELHPTVVDKAATLFFLLIKNHPFYDGNKRIAITALRMFLAGNGLQLYEDDATVLRLARNVAMDATDSSTIYQWLEQAIKPLPAA